MTDYGDQNSGVKNLFNSKVLSSASLDTLAREVESSDYIRSSNELKERYVPPTDFSDPANFVKFGSAEEYYRNSIERIYKTYPYDGSKKEKVLWELSSSYFDNYLFENEYPRTNGFLNFGGTLNGGGSSGSIALSTPRELFRTALKPQYLLVKGGPNAPSVPLYETDDVAVSFKDSKQKGNFYDTSENRAQNLSIDGTSGNTVEIWQTRAAVGSSPTLSFSNFDLWNDDGTNETAIASSSYGRFMLESRISSATGLFFDSANFHLTYLSGTTGAERVPLISVATNPVATDEWNHFSFTVINSGNELRIRSYMNGLLVDDLLTGSAVSAVTGTLNANIGSYMGFPTTYVKTAGLTAGVSGEDFNGYGVISGSLDEFRFWKTCRTSDQVKKNWFTQIGGGTNTDTANTNLGVYYKFNEGITGNSTNDERILDSSGRISNATFLNYDTGVSGRIDPRDVGSAMVLSNAAEREFKDPILYPSHPDVEGFLTGSVSRGKEYDYRNPSNMYATLPEWIRSDDRDSGRNTAFALTQVMASYFDDLQLQIQDLPRLKSVRYLSSSATTTVKPAPFNQRLLSSVGFNAEEIFANVDQAAALMNKDDVRDFEKKLYDVKNYIYQNIYNNLTNINKSKGTENSIRNLIRCFGVDDEIYKINFYADNAEYELANNFVDKTVRKSYADFNDTGRNNASVYSFSDTSDSNSVTFITGSNNTTAGFDRSFASTVEAEIILPLKPRANYPNSDKKYFSSLTSSLFGMHSAKVDFASDATTVMTWDSNDYANFQVYAESNTVKKDQIDSKATRFTLKSTVLPQLTSSFYLNQYDNQKWNFAVRVKHKNYPNSGVVSGSTGKLYDVIFEGVNAISDVIQNSFYVTGTISNAAGLNFITQKKRLYAGAHRTDFTGSVIYGSDAQVSSCRYWADDLSSAELKAHAIDATSFGIENPHNNAYLIQNRAQSNIAIPRSKTLILNWDFDTVTGSNSSGQFVTKDFSYTSGSTTNNKLWGVDLVNFLEVAHTARGDFFEANHTGSISREYLPIYKQQLPENINNSNTINIANTDDLAFTKQTRPIKFSFAVEKSMYQTMSEEMINFFVVAKEASALENMVGDPVNRYRQNYKMMEKVRELFFQRIQNTPDVEKYLDYYKWLDTGISSMIENLVPASAKFTNVSDVIESHLLERNKIRNKFPTMESKVGDPEASLTGVNDLTYNWKFGHAPTPPSLGIAASTTITATSTPTSGKEIVLRQLTAAGSTISYTLAVTAGTTGGNNFARTGADHGLTNLKTILDAAGVFTTSAVQNLGGGSYRLTITQILKGVLGNAIVTSNIDNYTVAGAASAAANGTFSGGINRRYQDDNCLWWNQKADRGEDYLSTGDSAVDTNRQLIHSATVQAFDRDRNKPMKLKLDIMDLRHDPNRRQIIFAETPPLTTENLSFNTTTFSEPTDCNDIESIDPNSNFKPQFTAVGSILPGKLASPIVFYSASAGENNTDPTGYHKTGQHHRDYYVETKDVPMQGPFTEHHVGGYQYRHVGFNASAASTRPEGWYTSVSGSTSGSTYYTIYNPSAISTAYPRADRSRDHIAKSPVNIKNIKNVTSSQISNVGTVDQYGSLISLGNYYKNYEIVQIPGREINNRYFVDNDGIGTGSVATSAIRSVYDRTLPDRGKNESVIVNRFSAPGGPETLGRGFLDVEAETYSVYNALPFRNLSVRTPLRTLLTRHSAFGGYDSSLGSPSASYQKTQRNGATRLKISGIPDTDSAKNYGLTLSSGTVFDNYWVQRMIPQSDMQYAWITASATSGPYGYSQPNAANASMASTDITFISASQHGSYYVPSLGNRYFGIGEDYTSATRKDIVLTDFIGLNTNFIDIIDTDNNTITQTNRNFTFVDTGYATNPTYGTVGLPAKLNAINLRRNGAGGFSSWKQVRQSYNPIVRHMKRNNKISIATQATIVDGTNDTDTILKQNVLYSFTEPVVTSKYKPLIHYIRMRNKQTLYMTNTYANNLVNFSMGNADINDKIGFNPDSPNQVYDDLKKIYIDRNLDPSVDPIEQVEGLTYREVVYPRESNTFLNKVRMRENYDSPSGSSDFNRAAGRSRTFWRDSLIDRSRTLGTARNASGIVIDSGSFKGTSYEGLLDLSCWPLDAPQPMVNIGPLSPATTFVSNFADRKGESSQNLLSSSAERAGNGELSHQNWIFNLYKVPIKGMDANANSTIANTNSVMSASICYEYPCLMLSGSDPNVPSGSNEETYYKMSAISLIPNWTANITASRNPWFDSYADYASDIRGLAKDYTVIPEFKISDHMDYYLKNGFQAENNSFMELLGGSTSVTSSANAETSPYNSEFFKVYSNSDFMKHFEVIKSDHNDTQDIHSPQKIKIICKAIKKLLPYQGFYPATRTVQLGQMFSSSYAPFIDGSSDVDGDQERLASLYQPFFAPGIMFNTIKSGIACDWPVITGSTGIKETTGRSHDVGATYPTGSVRQCGFFNFNYDWRMPFEAILEPHVYLPQTSSQDSLGASPQSSLDNRIYHMWDGYLECDIGKFPTAQPWRVSAAARTSGYSDFDNRSNYYHSASAGNLFGSRPNPYFSYNGGYDPSYSLAANNFMAETANFFLKEGKLKSFTSKPAAAYKPMLSGTTYYMDVVIKKTNNFVMYEGPSGSFSAAMRTSSSAGATSQIHTQSVSARGFAYGPRSAWVNPPADADVHLGMQPLANTTGPAQTPFTPPYFYGSSVARVTFKPHGARAMEAGDSDVFTLDEILSNARLQTLYYNEYNTKDGAALAGNYNLNGMIAGTGNPAQKNTMMASSSLNIFGKVQKKSVRYQANKLAGTSLGGTGKAQYLAESVGTEPSAENQAWVIETKFETPTLNFFNHNTSSFMGGSGLERNATRGMWRTFGDIPETNEGIFLELKESFTIASRKGPGNLKGGGVTSRSGGRTVVTRDRESEVRINTTGSLIDVCGFSANTQRIGELADSKLISEAVVAVPIDKNGNFFSIPKSGFNTQLENLEKDDIAVKAGQMGSPIDIKETSVSDMIKKMKQFYLPPHMDFITNKSINPFVMYMFSFEHKLSRQDLSHIWQNLMPDISVTAEATEAAIEHPVGTGQGIEFFGNHSAFNVTKTFSIPKNIRWMVFKVKQKASNNYYSLTSTEGDGEGFGFEQFGEGYGGSNLPYSYNWPYDYFSLVELAQIQAAVKLLPQKVLEIGPSVDQSSKEEVKTKTEPDADELIKETYAEKMPGQQGGGAEQSGPDQLPPTDMDKFGQPGDF